MRRWLVIGVLLCAACLPNGAHATHAIPVGELLTHDTFETLGTWDRFAEPTLTVDAADGTLRGLFSLADHVVTAADNRRQTDSVIEATTYLLSENSEAYYGIACRVDAQQHGYLFLVSADGDYSIRLSSGGGLDALVKWQSSQGVVRRGANARNVLKAVCDGSYLALYVNNTFLAETTDTRYQDGSTGIALGVGTSGVVDVAFDDIRVWSAAQ